MTAILHLSQPTDAGVAKVVLDLCRSQLAAGHIVTVACPRGPLHDRLVAAGVPWQLWRASRQPGPWLLREMHAVRTLVERVRPDLVHLHSSKAGLAGRLALRGETPTVFQPHAWSFEAADGLLALASTWWERRASRWTDALLCCSTQELRTGLTVGVRAPARVVLNGTLLPAETDLARWRTAVRQALQLGTDVPVAITVGRLCRQKGQDVAFRAWPLIRHRHPDAVLLVVGDGPDAWNLRRSAPRGVRLIGARSDVTALYAAADVAILPSRWEGLSLALLEGMAAGLPTVATAVGGSREVLQEGPAAPGGVVVPPEDPRRLAQATASLFSHRDLATALGAGARERAARVYTPEATAGAVEEVYRSVLAAS